MSFREFLLLNETLAYKDLMFRNPNCAILFGNGPILMLQIKIAEEL